MIAMKKIITLIMFIAVTCAFSQKKVMYNFDYSYEFGTLNDEISNLKIYKNYYWFKGGKIHVSKGANGGGLLNGVYKKYSRNSGFIRELGSFKKGLKKGVWKVWNEKGKISYINKWKKGEKNGFFIGYDSLENVEFSGFFRKDKKHGKWKYYFGNGKVNKIVSFKKNLKQGRFKRYGQYNNLLEYGQYHENLKHGRWIDLVKKDTSYFDFGVKLTKKKDDIFQRLKKWDKQRRENKKQRKKEKAKKKLNSDKGRKKESFFVRVFNKKIDEK